MHKFPIATSPSSTNVQEILRRASSKTCRKRARRKSSTSLLIAQMPSARMQKLEADRAKLVSDESRQTMAIMDDTLMALQTTSRFASICENYDYFEDILGPEIASVFQHICTAFNYECSSCDKKVAAPKADFVESMSDMSSALKFAMYSTPEMKILQDAVRSVVRLMFQKRPVSNAVRMDSVPSRQMSDFVQTMDELRGFFLKRLLTSEAKQNEQILFLENSETREKALMEQIEELEWELSQVEQSTATEMHYQNNKITELEDDLEKMITISSEAILQRRMHIFEEAEAAEKKSQVIRQILESEYQASLRHYDVLVDHHRQVEFNIRRKNTKISVEVDNWIMKYDKDMTQRLIVIDTLNDEYNIEKQNLANLEMQFAPIEKEYKLLVAEKLSKKQLRLAEMMK